MQKIHKLYIPKYRILEKKLSKRSLFWIFFNANTFLKFKLNLIPSEWRLFRRSVVSIHEYSMAVNLPKELPRVIFAAGYLYSYTCTRFEFEYPTTSLFLLFIYRYCRTVSAYCNQSSLYETAIYLAKLIHSMITRNVHIPLRISFNISVVLNFRLVFIALEVHVFPNKRTYCMNCTFLTFAIFYVYQVNCFVTGYCNFSGNFARPNSVYFLRNISSIACPPVFVKSIAHMT